MKLFCSASLQKQMGCKYEKAPVPENPLECWYAHLISLKGTDTLVAMLPEFRFCVLVWDFQETQWEDLNRLLVHAIRDALDYPFYEIPSSVINRYIPEDTSFTPCTTGDRGIIAKMSAVTKKLLESGHPSFLDFWAEDAFDPQEAQLSANDYVFVTKEHSRGIRPWQALQAQLRETYGKAVPALELEVSLDLEKYIARRTLIVSADAPFEFLHHYLQIAFRWQWNGYHTFKLPPVRDRDTQIQILDSCLPDDAIPPDSPYLWDREARLVDFLQAGDSFQYFYDPEEDGKPWKLRIRVAQCIPDCEEDLPICTLYEGKAPPEWVGGVAGYRKFCKIIQDPKHSKHDKMVQKGDLWLVEDSAEAINKRFPGEMQWLYRREVR